MGVLVTLRRHSIGRAIAMSALLLTVTCASGCSSGNHARTRIGAGTGPGQSNTVETSAAPGAAGGAGGGGNAAGSGAGGAGKRFMAPPAGPVVAARPITQGVTSGAIKIGVGYTIGANQTTQAFGVGGATVPEGRQLPQTVIDYINAHGGVAGRTIKPVYYENQDKPASPDAQAQADCAHFTQDTKVFAAVVVGDTRQSLVSCLAQHNTPLIATNDTPYDSRYYSQFDKMLYTPGGLDQDRVATTYISGLYERGYFDKGARIGYISADLPEWHRATDNSLKPALVAHGLHLAKEFYASGTTAQDYEPQMANAVLSFRSAQIDHVIFLDHGAGISGLFIATASGQGYFPRYGMNSYMYPQVQVSNQPPSSFNRALGVGFLPDNDVAAPQDPGADSNKKLCLQIMAKAGQKAQDRTGEQTLGAWCDSFFFLKAALNLVTGPIHPVSFAVAVESLGKAYQGPNTLLSSFYVGKHDGAGGTEDLVFDNACGCFKYLGRVKPID